MGKSVEERIRRHIENFANPDLHVSSMAERYMLRHYGVRAIDQLIKACDHTNPMTRLRAAWVLGYTKDPRAYGPILRLTEDPNERVRYDATVALGILGDKRGLQHLLRMYWEDDDTRPAWLAFQKCGPPALPVLKRLLRNRDSSVRVNALNILGDIALNFCDPECLELLKKQLNDPDPEIRADTEFWLGEIAKK